MAAQIDEKLCAGCGACVEVCPERAITIDQVAKIDPDICTECYVCIPECPNNAIGRPESGNASLPVYVPSQDNTPVLTLRPEKNPEPPRTNAGYPSPGPTNRGSLLPQILDFFRLNFGQGQGGRDGRGRGGGRGKGGGRGRGGGMRSGRGRGRRGT